MKPFPIDNLLLLVENRLSWKLNLDSFKVQKIITITQTLHRKIAFYEHEELNYNMISAINITDHNLDPESFYLWTTVTPKAMKKRSWPCLRHNFYSINWTVHQPNIRVTRIQPVPLTIYRQPPTARLRHTLKIWRLLPSIWNLLQPRVLAVLEQHFTM